MRVLKNGEVSSLFINKKRRIKLDEWMTAESHPTKGFAVRKGFHTLKYPIAPHLTLAHRAWFLVEIEDYKRVKRPIGQGGTWFIANRMRVVKRLSQEEVGDVILTSYIVNNLLQ
jgi:hypothetical protein